MQGNMGIWTDMVSDGDGWTTALTRMDFEGISICNITQYQIGGMGERTVSFSSDTAIAAARAILKHFNAGLEE